jgi:hypothetical protein
MDPFLFVLDEDFEPAPNTNDALDTPQSAENEPSETIKTTPTQQ